ncbi:hypothetical protein [Enterobacter hormaechei]|uniref:hypothetical protein n=1 Tax=Enterobacter hormaechei TaxID=158836 RepID=UPI00163C3C13|nr:hypothetical protein [Enterobacter hormaechei]
MSTLTKEWLQKTIAELEEERDSMPGVVNEDAAMALAAMKLALASLEAEPVCVIDQSNLDYLNSGSDADVWPASRAEMGDVLLYRAAPPVPVSVKIPPEKPHTDGPLADGWNACRAAMLQGAEPVSNRDELPLDYLQGLKDGLEWAAQLSEANHPHTGDWLYDDPLELAKAIRKGPDMPEPDGNSPVIPDGWVMVPVEPTEHMIVEGFESEPDEFFSDEEVWEAYDAMSGCQQAAHRAKLCWAAMIAAAPKQEVK